MEMTGEYWLEAPQQVVWDALNDPDILKRAIPGCNDLSKTSDSEFSVVVTAKVGRVKVRFTGNVSLSDLDPPNSYVITGEGQGGAAGFAKGGARVELVEDSGGTLLRYTVNATVGGKLVQIGSRLIDGVAKKMADDFFAGFADAVVASAAVGPAAKVAAEPPPAPGLAPRGWITLLVTAAVVLVLVLSLG